MNICLLLTWLCDGIYWDNNKKWILCFSSLSLSNNTSLTAEVPWCLIWFHQPFWMIYSGQQNFIQNYWQPNKLEHVYVCNQHCFSRGPRTFSSYRTSRSGLWVESTSPFEGQLCGVLTFSLVSASEKMWTNGRVADYLGRHGSHVTWLVCCVIVSFRVIRMIYLSKCVIVTLYGYPDSKGGGGGGGHVGPTGPRWAPCWPYEPCFLEISWLLQSQ